MPCAAGISANLRRRHGALPQYVDQETRSCRRGHSVHSGDLWLKLWLALRRFVNASLEHLRANIIRSLRVNGAVRAVMQVPSDESRLRDQLGPAGDGFSDAPTQCPRKHPIVRLP